MRGNMKHLHKLLPIVVFFSSALSNGVEAQARNLHETLTIVVPDVFSWGNAHAAIIRDPSAKQDVVVLNASTVDAITVDAALATLDRRRKNNPVVTGREVTLISSTSVLRGTRPNERTKFIERLIAELNSSPKLTVTGYGVARSVAVSGTRPGA